jgi:hypothetical protein
MEGIDDVDMNTENLLEFCKLVGLPVLVGAEEIYAPIKHEYFKTMQYKYTACLVVEFMNGHLVFNFPVFYIKADPSIETGEVFLRRVVETRRRWFLSPAGYLSRAKFDVDGTIKLYTPSPKGPSLSGHISFSVPREAAKQFQKDITYVFLRNGGIAPRVIVEEHNERFHFAIRRASFKTRSGVEMAKREMYGILPYNAESPAICLH